MDSHERTPLLDAQPNSIAPADPEITINTPKPDEDASIKKLIPTMLPLTLGVFIAAMDSTIIVSTYALIGSEFNQLQNTSWIATSYMLTMTCFQPLCGKLSDIFGRKPCMLFSYALFSLGCLFCGLARNLTELIAARALTGIGGGGMSTIVSIIMSDIIPLRSRGTWQGIINVVFALGTSSGAPIGGFLIDTIGWRWAFLLQVPLGVASLVLVSATLHIPTHPAASASDEPSLTKKLARIDFTGALLLSIFTFSLLLALDRGANVAWSDPYTIVFLAVFGLFVSLFLYVEFYRAKEPLAPKHIVLQPSLLACYACNFFCIASLLSCLFHVSLYLQAVLGMTAHEAGLWMIPALVAGQAGSVGGGLTIQATGKFATLSIISYAVQTIGGLILVGSTGLLAQSMLGIVIGWMLLHSGNGSGITTTLVAMIATADSEDQAVTTAVSYLFRSLGSVVGVSLSSTILQTVLRSELRSRLTGTIEGSKLDELIHQLRESLDSVGDIPGAVESYEKAIQAVLWFSTAAAFCAWLSAYRIQEKTLR